MATQVYGTFVTALRNDTAGDLDAATWRVALLTSSYTPNIDTDEFWDDVNANEASGGSYTANGVAIGTIAGAYDSANNQDEIDGDNVTLTDHPAYRYIVVMLWTGTAGTSRLVGYIDTGATQSAGNTTIQWHTDGILNLAAMAGA